MSAPSNVAAAVGPLTRLPPAAQWGLHPHPVRRSDLSSGDGGRACRAFARADDLRHFIRRERRRRPRAAPALSGQACKRSSAGLDRAHDLLATSFALFLEEWPLFLGVVLTVIAASSALGWLMSRWRVLPGTTAVWGSSPGAATAMVLMAEAYGADAQLVAFMQYLRVVFVAVAASVIARFWIDASGAAIPAIVWFPPIDWPSFLETLGIAIVGGILGRARCAFPPASSCCLSSPALRFIFPALCGLSCRHGCWR